MEPSHGYHSIAIHHSGNGSPDPTRIETLHMSSRGWSDIGYHILVDRNGTLYEGRDLRFKGSHVKAMNTGIFGIVVLGDFEHQIYDFSDDTLSGTHARTIGRAIGIVQRTQKITVLGGHSEFLPGHTACPGSSLLPIVQQVRTNLGLSAP